MRGCGRGAIESGDACYAVRQVFPHIGIGFVDDGDRDGNRVGAVVDFNRGESGREVEENKGMWRGSRGRTLGGW